MKIPFDHVILSSDENRMFLDFWPFVAYAYRTLFPGVKVTLAFLTERSADDPLVKELELHGNVHRMRPIHGIPVMTQAKMIRYAVASYQPSDEVCMTDDLDQLPIDWEWHVKKAAERAPDTMLMLGGEVYGPNYDGQVPAGMVTAEARLFKRLFATPPEPLTPGWYAYLYGLRRSDENHTNIMGPNFSDEALIVLLRRAHPIGETHVRRDYTVGQHTIDRGCWPYNSAQLEAGGFLHAHMARPYRQFKEGNDAIFDYIRRRYGGTVLPQPLS